MTVRRSLCLAVTVASLLATANAQSSESRFSVLQISSESAEVPIGSDVIVNARFTNTTSGETIGCFMKLGGFGMDYSYTYDITDESGAKVSPVIHNHQEAEFYSFRSCYLAPGQSIDRKLDLSNSFKFDHAGRYRIELSRLATGQVGDGWVKSNVLTITVVGSEAHPTDR